MPISFAPNVEAPPVRLIEEMRSPMLMVVRAVLLLSRVGNVQVTSWYRNPEHNRRVGGASASQHQLGTAFDLIVNGWPRERALPLVQRAAALTGAIVPASASSTSGRSVHVQAPLARGDVQRMLDHVAGRPGIRI